MIDFYTFIKPFFFSFSPETAHKVAISCLKHLPIFIRKKKYERLQSKVFNIDFSNPIGLAAGFDKNATVIKPLLNLGFGFIEVGTVTPKPQTGNARPRIFRLNNDNAIINRLGFNNKGIKPFKQNLIKNANKGVIGANIGKNKDSKTKFDDYLTLLKEVYGLSSYITINISSPNTPGLRDLEEKENLDELIAKITEEKKALSVKHNKYIPILLKIAPDSDENHLKSVAQIALKYKIDGLIVSNTSIRRDFNLHSHYKGEQGGLSGQPIFDYSNNALRLIYQYTKGQIPIIGVGGVFSGADAYKKIRLGASLVQIYTSLIFKGPLVVNSINSELNELLAKDGFNSISEAIGVDVKPDKAHSG